MGLRYYLIAPFFCSLFVFGQKPEFEVAAVKVNKSGEISARGQKILASGHLDFINTTMSELIMWAYMVRVDDITGPNWLDSERFDIVAKAPPNTSLHDARLMLRSLLADRFKLVVSQREKVIPVFALVIGKKVPVLTPPSGPGQPTCLPASGVVGQIHVECTNLTLGELAGYLPDLAPAYVNRPVVDLTGIKGAYDFKLDWVPLPRSSQGGATAGGAIPDVPAGPTIFDSLDKQFGLKLEKQRQPMPMLVINHIERVPTEN